MFLRTKENFTCLNCGKDVKGNGYTNHCPFCLWSRHVDVDPGDRREECQGLMKPIELEKKGEKFIIIHKCAKCGVMRRNRTSMGDNLKVLLEETRP